MDVKAKKPKKIKKQNMLESLKDVGSVTTKTLKKDLLADTSKDFVKQLLGIREPKAKVSGEMFPGESLEFDQAMSAEHAEKVKLQRQLALERKLRESENAQVEKKTGELKLQLHALMGELEKLAEETEGLAKETQIASMQAPIEPGVYHLIFFEKMLEFIKSFRKKVHEASVWLSASNKRAQKKNAWGARYKKYGAKFLLSGEHYLTRSAG